MMNREELIHSARELNQIGRHGFAEYMDKMDILTDLMNKRICSRSDLLELIGDDNEDLMKNNHVNHVRFMASIFAEFSAEEFTDTILWAFRVYRAREFKSSYWIVALETWIEIYREVLSEACYDAVYPYYHWMQVHINDFWSLTEQKPEAE